jgi:hypothetical protein
MVFNFAIILKFQVSYTVPYNTVYWKTVPLKPERNCSRKNMMQLRKTYFCSTVQYGTGTGISICTYIPKTAFAKKFMSATTFC